MRNIIIFHPLYTVVFEKQRSKSGVEDELSMHVGLPLGKKTTFKVLLPLLQTYPYLS